MFLFIYRMPLWVIGVICVIAGMVWAKVKELLLDEQKTSFTRSYTFWRLINAILLVISIAAIAVVTLKRGYGEHTVILEPFISLNEAKIQPEIYRSLLMNVALFMPFGLSFSELLPRRWFELIKFTITVLAGILFSVAIEWLQYKYHLGTTEVDDIICNAIGAFLGATVLLYPYIFSKLRKQRFYDKRLFKYLSITFSMTLICWGLLSAFTSHEAYFSFRHPISVALHILGGFSPFIAAMLTMVQKPRLKNTIEIYKRYNKYHIKSFIVFVIAEICIFGIASRQLNLYIPWYSVPLILITSIFIYGGNEEIGWRGTMQPILEEHFPFPVATIIAGIVWSVWHIPLWFVPGASQQNIPFILFLIFGILISFWLASIYKKTESVLFCTVFHGLTNTLLSVFIIKVNTLLILGLIGLTIYSIYVYYCKS